MDLAEYGWWIGSRAAAITAFLLLSLSVLGGLALAMKLVPPRSRARIGKLHERVALLALGMIALHGALLLGDHWLNPTVTQLLVPFTLDYRPVFTGLGILAGYLAALLALSFYLRKHVGARRWRKAHRFIPVAWVLAAVHAIGAGSDAGRLWLQVPLYGTIAGVLALLALRWGRRTPKPPVRQTPEQRAAIRERARARAAGRVGEDRDTVAA